AVEGALADERAAGPGVEAGVHEAPADVEGAPVQGAALQRATGGQVLGVGQGVAGVDAQPEGQVDPHVGLEPLRDGRGDVDVRVAVEGAGADALDRCDGDEVVDIAAE